MASYLAYLQPAARCAHSCTRVLAATIIALATVVVSARQARIIETPAVGTPAPIMSLKKVPVPGPSAAALAAIVQDKAAAIKHGKALFCDTRAVFLQRWQVSVVQVVDFYNRGGGFTIANQPVPDPTIRPLGLTQMQKEELVAFLLGLTDERVRYRRASFDHPSIYAPHEHDATAARIKIDSAGNAVDVMQCIAAVGPSGPATPLQPFLQLNPLRR